jgi:hypothetical protein
LIAFGTECELRRVCYFLAVAEKQNFARVEIGAEGWTPRLIDLERTSAAFNGDVVVPYQVAD